MPGSITYRLLSKELNVAAVNEAGHGPSMFKALLIITSKAETDTLHPLGHAAIEVKPDSITDEDTQRVPTVSKMVNGEEAGEATTYYATKGHPSLVRSSRMPCSLNCAL
jgi:hypothetical protein